MRMIKVLCVCSVAQGARTRPCTRHTCAGTDTCASPRQRGVALFSASQSPRAALGQTDAQKTASMASPEAPPLNDTTPEAPPRVMRPALKPRPSVTRPLKLRPSTTPHLKPRPQAHRRLKQRRLQSDQWRGGLGSGGLETPSDSESLLFPPDLDLDLDLEEDMRRLGVASSSRGPPSLPPQPEDTVDESGSRWRRFSSNGTETRSHEPDPGLRQGSSHTEVRGHTLRQGHLTRRLLRRRRERHHRVRFLFLPENTIESYEEVMDHLFRYVMGTLELMVSEDYVVVYLCAGAQKNQVPALSWLRECYTTIDRRLRKNLKGFLVVHPTWFIKALITIVKPFISSKFSRKLRFVDSLLELSMLIPTERAQIPHGVTEFDQTR
ncbi:hypothetical protein WMY93_019144 [Mugilogobius chulae]|uniref:CRAL-TRIO domain-containing protein n=1 Tax=Mugilogobius chulae TaxID=88201 RepID=A0AAW0NDG9_9GOBI